MAGYAVHVSDGRHETVHHLDMLDELAGCVELEQLAHELNPVTPNGYVVTFRVVGPGRHTAAAGHFYVRASTCVVAAAEIANRPS